MCHYVRFIFYFSSLASYFLINRSLSLSFFIDWFFYLTLVALIASVIGDAFLVLPVVFPVGVVSFGCAQVMYTVMFGARGLPNSTWPQIIVLLLLVGGVCIGLFMVLRDPMYNLFKNYLNVRMVVLIVVYFSLISMMLWSALLQHAVISSVQSVLALVGGILFFISDLMIAVSAVFSSHWIFKRRILVMMTYYFAQLLIAMSVLLLC